MIRILTLAYRCRELFDFLSHLALCNRVSGDVVVPKSLDSGPTDPG